MADSRSLTDLNRAVHAEIDELALIFLERLTELSLDEARAGYLAFSQRLEAHLRVEEESVLPLLRRVHHEHGDPNDPLPRQVEGDHTILTRAMRKAEAALQRLRESEAPARRRALVLELDAFLLLRRVLEHHDERELRLAYPLLDAHLSDEERALLRARLLG